MRVTEAEVEAEEGEGRSLLVGARETDRSEEAGPAEEDEIVREVAVVVGRPRTMMKTRSLGSLRVSSLPSSSSRRAQASCLAASPAGEVGEKAELNRAASVEGKCQNSEQTKKSETGLNRRTNFP